MHGRFVAHRRTAGRALACLIAGAAATIGVAWTLSISQGVSWENCGSRVRGVRALDEAAGEGTGWLTVERFAARGAIFLEGHVLPGGGSTSTAVSGGPSIPDPTPEQIAPGWSCPMVLPWRVGGWPPNNPVNSTYVDARGRPMLALVCTYRIDRTNSGKLVGIAQGALSFPGTIVPKGSWYGGGYPTTLPLRPRWLGFAGDSAIYALAIAAVVSLVSWGRRGARRRKGCCGWCGYDLSAGPSGAPCPECGRLSVRS